MISITLVRMGMDFYDETDKQASDMQNFRLRPQLDNPMPSISDWYLKDKDGHYITGDFNYLRGDEYRHDGTLGIDFTDYGTDMQDNKRYKLAMDYRHQLTPTLSSIKAWLEEALGDEIKLTLEEGMGLYDE